MACGLLRCKHWLTSGVAVVHAKRWANQSDRQSLQATDAEGQESAKDSAATEGEDGWQNVSDITQAAATRQIQELLAAGDREAAAAALAQMQARLKQLVTADG